MSSDDQNAPNTFNNDFGGAQQQRYRRQMPSGAGDLSSSRGGQFGNFGGFGGQPSGPGSMPQFGSNQMGGFGGFNGEWRRDTHHDLTIAGARSGPSDLGIQASADASMRPRRQAPTAILGQPDGDGFGQLGGGDSNMQTFGQGATHHRGQGTDTQNGGLPDATFGGQQGGRSFGRPDEGDSFGQNGAFGGPRNDQPNGDHHDQQL